MKPPTLSYKMTFLLGGVSFAALTYMAGTLVYRVEDYMWSPGFTGNLNLAGSILEVFRHHLFTFVPWVLGTTLLSTVMGYLFDKQIKYRQKAEELQARAEALAVTDGLTLLHNHRYFMEHLALEIKRTERAQSIFSLLFLDIDDFKKYNDTHGHLAGDDALRSVAMAAKAAVRETDIVARYGGEEIVIIALGAEKMDAVKVAEEVRRRVELSCPVTVSIGVSGFPVDGATVDELIETADRALYDAKGHGKNQVCVAADQPPAEEPSIPSIVRDIRDFTAMS